MTNPLKSLPPEELAEWVDLIANCGNGERMAMQQVDGLDSEHIDEVMLENDYERCVRCDWYEEVSALRQIDDEAVCDDCLTEEERDNEQ